VPDEETYIYGRGPASDPLLLKDATALPFFFQSSLFPPMRECVLSVLCELHQMHDHLNLLFILLAM
jgi:hypothetical protein